MQTEIEAKFLNLNHDDIRAQLKKLGVECVQPMRLMRRRNFDYPDKRLEKIGGWIRVRDEGNKVTLSYKQLNDRSLHGTKEINVEVSDFQATCDLLETIGIKSFGYQESKRESWALDGVEVDLDEWPWIKPFIEIEALTEEKLKSVINKLGLKLANAKHGSVEVAYQAEYKISDPEIYAIEELKFGPVPKWLEKRKK